VDSGVDIEWANWPVPNFPGDVEAGAPNPESYTDNKDGTVSDNVTGLMWEQASGYGTNAQVIAYCANLSLAGHCDWRVPSWIELQSIVDYASSPAINPTYFPGTASTDYWASTLAAGVASNGWRVNFSAGNAGWASLSEAAYVHCVR
jgi:hypothetical protein